jgi:dihydroorotate dehydrogenase electron transfer subunit
MKKLLLDLIVKENIKLHKNYVLLKMTHRDPLPSVLPGQFAELRVDNAPNVFLRRPISINFVDRDKNEIWFLIQLVGEGTRKLAQLSPGDVLNTILPLGNGFSFPAGDQANKPLLIGGGVGTAPMLMLGSALLRAGLKPTFLLGARSEDDLLQLDQFSQLGDVFVTTEDGSKGEKGFVTQHRVLQKEHFTMIYTCGPRPMMQAVARYAKANGIECEVSLENRMACGLGACLCCVEKTQEGHVCVCKEGPVFNIKKLLWQI